MSRLILFNKPFRVLCQFTASGEKRTLADFIPVPGVYPAGRLDYDSEGLLLLTDDGVLQARLTQPAAHTRKTYLVQVEGTPTPADLAKLEAGIMLKDGLSLPAEAEMIEPPAIWERHPPIRQRRHIPDSWLRISLTEGRNRQVRRMTAALGFPTLRLVRWQIGDWSVASLAPGEYQQLSLPRHANAPPRRDRSDVRPPTARRRARKPSSRVARRS